METLHAVRTVSHAKWPLAWQVVVDIADRLATDIQWTHRHVATVHAQLSGRATQIDALAPLRALHASKVCPIAQDELRDRESEPAQRSLVEWLAVAELDDAATIAALKRGIARRRTSLRNRCVAAYRADGSVDTVFLAHAAVPDGLLALCTRHRTDPSLPALALAIWLFGNFIAIHPFMDGNGRGARRLLVSVLRRFDLWGAAQLPLAALMYRDRARHIDLIREAVVDGKWDRFFPYALQWIAAAAELAILYPAEKPLRLA